MSAELPVQDWQRLICTYYNGCSAGDVDMMLRTLHPDVEHWFLAPNTGSECVAGAEHLARYWRKVTGRLSARWVVDAMVTSGEQAVIEWTMFWSPPDPGKRVATRGAEWFTRLDGRIREIRSYYQLRETTTELDGFPYDARSYSVVGRERTALHPDAELHGATSQADRT